MLGFSMPTVFQNIIELIEMGLICEAGEYGSTGGRKAKILTLKEGFRCVVGLEVTKNHIRQVLMDMSWKVLDTIHVRCPYSNTQEYYDHLGDLVEQLLSRNAIKPDGEYGLIGVGISIPGIIDQDMALLRQSHTLGVSNISVRQFAQNIPYRTCFENDANNAAYAEIRDKQQNLVYLSLNDTVGGAIYLNGEIYKGDNYKSAELGHMILRPGGETCYCGKKGCVDAYCSARVLQRGDEETLEQFFAALENGDAEHVKRWEEYLDDLALTVTNIRMLMDCDIVLGGYVGGYLNGHIRTLEKLIRQYNNFDDDLSYLSVGHHRRECSAIGAAKHMVDEALEDLLG